MKFKSINKLLSIGILLNSLNLNSFAGTLSGDTRYETFEGSSITIDDILEEDRVDVEVQGNSIVNILDSKEKDAYFHDNALSTRVRTFKCSNLKPYTTYTLKVNVSNLNTLYPSDLKIYYTYYDENGVLRDLYPEKHSFKMTKGQNELVFTTYEVSQIETQLHLYVDEQNSPHGVPHQFSFESSECILLEGDYSGVNIPYFEGIKSVGELENLSITSQSKNLIPIDDYFNWNSTVKGVNVKKEPNGLRLNGTSITNTGDLNIEFTHENQEILLAPGKIYRMHFELLEGNVTSSSNKTLLQNYAYKYQSPDGTINWNTLDKVPIIDCRNNTDFAKISWIRLYSYTTESLTFDNALYQIQIEEISEDDINKEVSFIEHKTNSKEFVLSEPLRGLPNGIKDRIIKKNGQWVIERNCAQITFDGDEDWIKTGVGCSDTITTFTYEFDPGHLKSVQVWGTWQLGSAISDKFNFIGDELYDYNRIVSTQGMAQGHSDSAQTDRWYVGISNSRISSVEISSFKQWLVQNPITVVYQLANPIYEPLNIDSTLNLYKDLTYISSNSTIPANIKIIIDRTLNRAVESTMLAQNNPSIDNISQARYWDNLLNDSVKKDYLQNIVNSINNITDLGTIEALNLSSNSDVYIKGKNTLSLSLDNNYIVFDDFDGTENMELPRAINLTVSSSLPYDIKSTLATDISNSDKSTILNPMILNIKSSSENNYESFTSVGDEIILSDYESAGTNKVHNLDLMLNGGIINKVDVYKTSIKIEINQK